MANNNDGKDKELKNAKPLVGMSQFMSINPEAVAVSLNGNPVQILKRTDKATGTEMLLIIGKKPLVYGNAMQGTIVRNDMFIERIRKQRGQVKSEPGKQDTGDVDADKGNDTGKG